MAHGTWAGGLQAPPGQNIADRPCRALRSRECLEASAIQAGAPRGAGGKARPVPIIESRVTSLASACSSIPRVPGGIMGCEPARCRPWPPYVHPGGHRNPSTLWRRWHDQQPFPKCCIDPGPDHHRHSVVRTDAGFMGFDDAVERGRIDLTLLGQQCFQRPHTQVHFTEVRMFVAVLRFHISNSRAYHGHLASNG